MAQLTVPMGIIVEINCKQVETLQKITTFFTRNFGQKSPHMVFLTPCPTWPKCHFGQVNLDSTVLTKFFWLVFFIEPPW
jgi:hypothetical protein